MEAEIKQTSPLTQMFDVYKWAAWLHANLKQVVTGTIIVAVTATVLAIYSWKKNQDELLASETFFNLPQVAAAGERMPHPTAQALLSVASQFPSTSVGMQAELLAANTFFSQGKYEDSQREFSKFMVNHELSQFAPQAAIGVAASLEAQNKIPEAVQAYKEALAKYSGTGISSPVKLTLARLFEEQKQFDQALRYYDELTSAATPNPYDPWAAEARERKAELLIKHPELVKAAPALMQYK